MIRAAILLTLAIAIGAVGAILFPLFMVGCLLVEAGRGLSRGWAVMR